MKCRLTSLSILLFIIPVFSACYRSIPQTLPIQGAPTQPPTLSTPTEEHPSVILESSPTGQQNRKVATPTISELPHTEGKTPTSTPQHTPTLAVTLPKLQGASSSYTLTHPSAVTLAKIQLSRSSQSLYSNTSIDTLLYPAFHSILDYEWKNTYTPSIDSKQIFPMIPNFYDHSQGRLTNTMLMDVIGDLVVSQLNHLNYSLEDRGVFALEQFTGRAYQVEIDGDSFTEWLVQIQNPDGYYLGEDSFWVTLEQSDANQYLRLENQIPWQYGFSSIESPKGVITDLTGDGLTDIGIAEQTPLSGGASITIHVAKGSPQGFTIITPSIEIETSDLPGTSTEMFEWVFPTVDSIPFLRVQTNKQSSGWPCITLTQTEYHWDGAIIQATETEPKIPDTLFCAINQAIEEGSNSNYPAAIQILETTLHHPTESTTETLIFILYRLALYHLLADQFQEAQTYLDRIAETARSDSIAIAQALNDRIEPLGRLENLSPYKLCLAAESLSTIDSNTPWDPIGGIQSYPYSGYPQGYPTPLCDTYQFQVEFLNARFPYPDASLLDDLKNSDFPFLAVVDLYKTNPESYWLLITEDNDPNLIFLPTQASQDAPDQTISILGFENGRWGRVNAAPLSESVFYNLLDLTADGIIDLAFTQPALNPDWNPCELDQTAFELFVISTLGNGWLIPFSDAVCLSAGEDPDFTVLLADTDHNGTIDSIEATLQTELFDLELLSGTNGPRGIPTNWYRKLYRTANIDYLLTDLTNNLVNNPDKIAMRNEIDGPLAHWHSQSNLEHYIFAQLTYLSALQYEMTGEIENARNTFYRVWQTYPDTIWATLASTRLDISE